MNKLRREIISSRIIPPLVDAGNILSCIIDAEQDSFDNIPENLQSGDRFENMEVTLESLEEIADNLDDSIEKLKALL